LDDSIIPWTNDLTIVHPRGGRPAPMLPAPTIAVVGQWSRAKSRVAFQGRLTIARQTIAPRGQSIKLTR